MRIAMWSGPRNLSSAMMYAFGNRTDCDPWDEPFYGAYLAQSGLDHPMQEVILAAQPAGAVEVIAGLAKPPSKPVQYYKLMSHHMLPGFPLDWAKACTNVHLLRHPARVIASYAAKRDVITLDDIGFAQAQRIHAALPGPVIDSADIRADPEAMLRALCAAINLPFDPAMLSWPSGPKSFDGPWAPHWYDAVHRSTGFAATEGPLPEVAAQHCAVLEAALPIYETMRAARLRL